MKDLKTRIAEKFKDKDFEKEYHRTAALYRLAGRVLLLRKQRGLTQKELAEKVGTTQAVVSRLESASVKPSIETVLKFAEALDAVLDFRLTPIEDARRKSENLRKNSSVYEYINLSDKPKKSLENSIRYQRTNIIFSKPQQNNELITALFSLTGHTSLKNIEPRQ